MFQIKKQFQFVIQQKGLILEKRNNVTTEEKSDVENFLSFNVESGGSFEEDSANDSEGTEISEEPCSSKSINSYSKDLNMLKKFARDDFTAFQHLKNLDYYENCTLQQKMERFRQTHILDFFILCLCIRNFNIYIN